MFGQHEDQGEAVFKDRNHVENDVPPIKIRKLQYDDELYKPPCSEELHTLKETANLFHSTLFRLQVSPIPKEVNGFN